jgi:hypothetical protein
LCFISSKNFGLLLRLIAMLPIRTSVVLKAFAVSLTAPAFAIESVYAGASVCPAMADRAGFTPYKSQVVTGFVGQRLYLHPKYPDDCADLAPAECKPSAYVVAGDKVAIGDACGTWRTVKFAGKQLWLP